MMRPAILGVLLLSALPLAAQKKEFVELQREMALLQDTVREHDRKLTEMKGLLEQLLAAVNQSNSNISGLDAKQAERAKEQKETLAAPLSAVNTKVDALTMEVQAMRDDAEESKELLKKLQLRMVDLDNTIKVLQTPAAPPPPTGGDAPPAGNTAAAGKELPPQGMTADSVLQGARRAQTAGQNEYALQQYQTFLRYYGDTEYAPEAQLGIGQIYYASGDYRAAIEAFDLVIEKFPDSSNKNEAHFMKARALSKSSKRAEAILEYRSLINKAAGTEYASRAAADLKSMGAQDKPGPPASSQSSSGSKRRRR
jgi:TolA-binding protein